MTTDEARPMITLALAGEVVSDMVRKNAETILATKTLGRQRQTDSRNVLSESMFSRWELVSMLAVAMDRLAVFEALTPTPSVEQGVAAVMALPNLFRSITELSEKDVRTLVEAVLTR